MTDQAVLWNSICVANRLVVAGETQHARLMAHGPHVIIQPALGRGTPAPIDEKRGATRYGSPGRCLGTLAGRSQRPNGPNLLY